MERVGYMKPMVLADDELAEGVFAASGAKTTTCYSVTAAIKQTPETGREDYRIQVDAHHSADHGNSKQILTISFNQPVTYCWSSGQLVSGDGTATLQIAYYYWQNPTDNIGFGDLVVKSGDALAITGVSVGDEESRW